MTTRNHDPEPMQTDSGPYSEAKPPADEGPQRSTDAGARERDEALEDAVAVIDDRERVRIEVATLRERLAAVEQERDAEAHAAGNHAGLAERMLRSACDLRDALDSVAGALGVDTSTDAETEARACVSAIAALREEVERLRGELGQAIEDRNTSHTECCRLWQTERDARVVAEAEVARLRGVLATEKAATKAAREARAAAESDLIDMAGQRDAAERRAEEAEGRLERIREASSSLPPVYAYGDNQAACAMAEALTQVHALAGHPPQQQTPAPPRCDRCGYRLGTSRDCARPGCAPTSTPEGEPSDEDADPTKWEPGDVVVRPGLMDGEEYELNTRSSSHWGFFRRPWRLDPSRGPVLMLLDTEARSKGWRRIRRAGEVGR